MVQQLNTATSSDRVRAHTDPEVNGQIDQATQECVIYYAKQPEPVIASRLEELEHEWDIDRLIETSASSFSLLGLLLSITTSRKWLLLPGIMLVFLAQHALQGWCPPMIVLRRLGIRTRGEIDSEKFALKAIRGDFDALSTDTDDMARVSDALKAVRS